MITSRAVATTMWRRETSVHVLICKQGLQQVILKESASLVEGVLVSKIPCCSLTNQKPQQTGPTMEHGWHHRSCSELLKRGFPYGQKSRNTALGSSWDSFWIMTQSVVSGTDKNEKQLRNHTPQIGRKESQSRPHRLPHHHREESWLWKG